MAENEFMPVSSVLPVRWRLLLVVIVAAGADSAVAADVVKEGEQGTGLTTRNVVSKRPVPKRDPADQPFRRAPMGESPRSIAMPLSTNLHIAFDTELLRIHTAWVGPSLNLFGPPYHGGKEPFICTYDGTALWTMPQEY